MRKKQDRRKAHWLQGETGLFYIADGVKQQVFLPSPSLKNSAKRMPLIDALRLLEQPLRYSPTQRARALGKFMAEGMEAKADRLMGWMLPQPPKEKRKRAADLG